MNHPWPEARKELLVSEEITIVFQVNGKLRGQAQFAKDADKDSILTTAKADPKVQAFLEGKEIVKEIYVPGKLVNLAVKGKKTALMSRFLPDDFDSSKSLALIAGKGIYPQLLAERARKAGISLRLIELGGETSPELIESFGESERSAVKVGQVGKLLKELKRLGAGYAVMAGRVTPGKLFRGLHPDLKAIRMLAGLERKNAETIFGGNWRGNRKVGRPTIGCQNLNG